MWKFWKRFGGGSSRTSAQSSSLQGSVADLRDKFFLETVSHSISPPSSLSPFLSLPLSLSLSLSLYLSFSPHPLSPFPSHFTPLFLLCYVLHKHGRRTARKQMFVIISRTKHAAITQISCTGTSTCVYWSYNHRTQFALSPKVPTIHMPGMIGSL